MKNHCLRLLLPIGVSCMTSVFAAESSGTQVLQNNDCKVAIVNDTDLQITLNDGTARVFKPEFTVLYSEENPQKLLRRGNVGTNHGEALLYNVPTWGREAGIKSIPKSMSWMVSIPNSIKTSNQGERLIIFSPLQMRGSAHRRLNLRITRSNGFFRRLL